MRTTRTWLIATTSLAAWAGAGSAGAQPFSFPLERAVRVSAYYDHGAGSAERDWNCGCTTYNGHRGTDFAAGYGTPIYAAADGTVEMAVDGFRDDCTSADVCGGACCGGSCANFGNYVKIRHGSSVAIYGHMRNGSIVVSPGASVACGQQIGQVASSGCSTGNHLHFEPRQSGSAVDPFHGPCNGRPSLWVSQGGYCNGCGGRLCSNFPSRSCDTSPGPGGCPPGYPTEPTCDEEPSGSGMWRLWWCVGTDADGTPDEEAIPCPYGCIEQPGPDRCADPPDRDGDGVPRGMDCNDRDPSIHPGAPDPCMDGIDQDCDGMDDPCADADGDGVAAGPDCDDMDPSIHPGASETCGDGIDQDCDGSDLACPPPPPPDAGCGQELCGGDEDAGSDAAAPLPPVGDDASLGEEDGGSRRATGASVEGGCSCRALPVEDAGTATLGWLLLLGVLRRRRERRDEQTQQ